MMWSWKCFPHERGGFQYTVLLIGLYFGVLFTFTSGAANVTMIGSTCPTLANCSTTIHNSVCDATKKTCQCSPNFFVPSSNKKLCSAKLAVNTVCDAKDKHQCKDINAECKSSNGTKCLCKDAYYLKGSTCTSRSGVSKTFIEISTIILAILALRCNQWFVE